MPISLSLRSTAVCVVVAALVGCAELLGTGSVVTGHRPPAQGGIYTGPECARYQTGDTRLAGVFSTYDDARQPIFLGNRTPGSEPIAGLVFVTCVDATGLDGAQADDAIVADHLDFDDRRFDHVRAAAIVIDCALNPGCSAAQSRDVLGMVAGYARRVDARATDAVLAAAGAPPALREAVFAKLGWAQATIAARVEQLDPRRRELWVGIPERVWTERATYFAQHASLYAELDPLLAAADRGDGDLAGIARGLRALRGRYLAACRAEGCLFTPVVFATTRALALIAVRERDVPTALAEQALLADERMQTQVFSRAMLAALLPETQREADRWAEYDAATRRGADAASLRAMFGEVAPIQISADGPWVVWGRRDLPNLTAVLPTDGLVRVEGNVRAVRRDRERAVVAFADLVTTYTDADCRETNRIDGITSGGTIVYRQICSNYRTRTERTTIDPIDVPYEDAGQLRPGELVSALVTGNERRGAIVDAERESQITQVRGHRLRVPEVRADGPERATRR